MKMYREMTLLKALADESRVRALLALRGGELCVCQLIALLGLAPSTVSKHLFILRQAELVSARKKGRWIYYRLPGEEALAPVLQTLEWLDNLFRDNEQVLADENHLQTILRTTPEELCHAPASVPDGA
jgi:DNA-binding transcriptional ArsR family regulator